MIDDPNRTTDDSPEQAETAAPEVVVAEGAAEQSPASEAAPVEADSVEADSVETAESSASTPEADFAAEVDMFQPIEAESVREIVEEEEEPFVDVAPIEEVAEEEKPTEAGEMDWFILKVQSNREESIADGLRRRVKVAGLEHMFGDVIVPTEKVTEFKGGKKRIVKRKLYPGYLVVNMMIDDDSWFLVRETPGIGDFTGAAGRPSPMLPHEIQRIVATTIEETEDQPKLKISFRPGDRVKINEGNFESFEGEVDSIDEANGFVTVMINIFGRSTPVELEYWQIESL